MEQFGTVWNRLTIRSPQSGANNHGKTCQGKMSPGQNVPLEVRAKCPPVGQGKMSPKKSLEVRVGREMSGQNVSRAICPPRSQGSLSPRAICLQGSLSLNRNHTFKSLLKSRAHITNRCVYRGISRGIENHTSNPS